MKDPMQVYFREMSSDLETPVSAYLKVAQQGNSFLLESVEQGERIGRYSFIGTGEKGKFIARGHQIERFGCFGSGSETVSDPLAVLYQELVHAVPIPDVLPHFCGGAVGYTSYDMVRLYENLPDNNPDPLGLPDIQFFVPEGMVIFDHLKHKLFIVAIGNETDAQAVLDTLQERLRQPLQHIPGSQPASQNAQFVSNFTPEGYQDVVEQCLEYIRAGDIFQVVPSQRFSAPLTVEPFALYRALRSVNPSPYLGFLDFGDVQLVASSPESLCNSNGHTIVTRPIAGTRKRGDTPEADAALAAELLADEKECAEHLMLVDLGRNDLGRVAKYGSVRVRESFTIERYSHVMHIVSGIEAELAAGKTPLDALASTLPMGTVSGAPKIRAMEIIDQMEPVRRGPYGGAFGYIAFDGSMDMALTLRTFVINQGMMHIQTGAGVVADSVPLLEHQECVNKAAGLMKAVELAERGL